MFIATAASDMAVLGFIRLLLPLKENPGAQTDPERLVTNGADPVFCHRVHKPTNQDPQGELKVLYRGKSAGLAIVASYYTCNGRVCAMVEPCESSCLRFSSAAGGQPISVATVSFHSKLSLLALGLPGWFEERQAATLGSEPQARSIALPGPGNEKEIVTGSVELRERHYRDRSVGLAIELL